MEHTSEVARLRRTIEEEYTAAQRALTAPAMVGAHAFITARMENIQRAHATLQTLVGEEAATKLVAETLENA
jgi:hypothetical protein